MLFCVPLCLPPRYFSFLVGAGRALALEYGGCLWTGSHCDKSSCRAGILPHRVCQDLVGRGQGFFPSPALPSHLVSRVADDQFILGALVQGTHTC